MSPLDSPWWTWALCGFSIGWCARRPIVKGAANALQWLRGLR